MKVKELIKQLKQQDPEKEVMIQQGEEFDYMVAYTVKEKELLDTEEFYSYDSDDDEHNTALVVVIEYS
jgi:hypothetical protein